jgi:hypothetical protein
MVFRLLAGSFASLFLTAACSSSAPSAGTPPQDASTSSDSSGREAGQPPPPPDDGGVVGKSAIGWAIDFPDDVLDVIGAHKSAFTHVAVLVYDLAGYTSGVAPFWRTPAGQDAFQHGMTSATMAQKVHGMGLKFVPAMHGGQEYGSNQGMINILDDSPPGTQAGFISAMVSEATTKNFDGFTLDLAMGGAPAGLIIDSEHYGTKMETFLGAFRAALHAHKMVLLLAFVPNDVKQSCTSYGNGVFDLLQLGRYVDLAMMEAFGTTLGTGGSTCPKNYTDPTGCFGGDIFAPFANDVDLLCANTAQQPQMTVMMNASPTMTNPFAGDAMALVESYGIPSVSLFPQVNMNKDPGDAGNGDDAGEGGDAESRAEATYAIYDSTGMSPAGTDWFTLLSAFLAH